MNTEKLVVVKKSNGLYSNKHLAFEGSLNDAKVFAITHGFWGGVEEFVNGKYKVLCKFNEKEIMTGLTLDPTRLTR